MVHMYVCMYVGNVTTRFAIYLSLCLCLYIKRHKSVSCPTAFCLPVIFTGCSVLFLLRTCVFFLLNCVCADFLFSNMFCNIVFLLRVDFLLISFAQLLVISTDGPIAVAMTITYDANYCRNGRNAHSIYS